MKPRLLLFYPVFSVLIKKDAEMFSEDFDVRIYGIQAKSKWEIPLRIIGQFFFLIKNIFRTRIMISRFVGYQTILPVLFSKISGKPVICILGGLECIKFPSVKTGSYLHPLLATVTRWCLRNATHLCPVHSSLIFTDYTYQDQDYPHQGYKYFVKNCTTPATVIANGFDPEIWVRTGNKKPNSFITVAGGIEEENIFRLKGVDLFFGIAHFFPQCTFTIVGGKKDFFTSAVPANLVFLPDIPNDKLKELYSAHEFYLQLSMTEGFPNAICEAMLCKCIPVGSNVGGLPEIVGDEKLILKRKDINELKQIINYVLTIDRAKAGAMARDHIAKNYTLKIREKKFNELFSKLQKSK